MSFNRLAAVRAVDPRAYWDRAGTVGYGNAMFGSSLVERHVNRRVWDGAIAIARQLGMERSASVLDLGCGDGAFANTALAANFAAVDGYDLSELAIRRAAANAPGSHVRFQACDITSPAVAGLPRYDGAFLIGVLHHVKSSAPAVIRSLRNIADRVVVLEPNGGHLLRKLLELTPSYRAAGEDSVRRSELERMFTAAGYRRVAWRRLNVFPNFTPQAIFRLFRGLEPFIEATPGLRALCTADLYGFSAEAAAVPDP